MVLLLMATEPMVTTRTMALLPCSRFILSNILPAVPIIMETPRGILIPALQPTGNILPAKALVLEMPGGTALQPMGNILPAKALVPETPGSILTSLATSLEIPRGISALQPTILEILDLQFPVSKCKDMTVPQILEVDCQQVPIGPCRAWPLRSSSA